LEEEWNKNIFILLIKMLTGLPDADREILMKLDEREFLYVCSPPKNSYSRKICNEDLFRNRLQKKYPESLEYKPENQTWKKYYLSTIYYNSKIEEEGIEFLKTGNPKDFYHNFPSFLKDTPMHRLMMTGQIFSTREILLNKYLTKLNKPENGKYFNKFFPELEDFITFQELSFYVDNSFIPYKDLDNTDKLFVESLIGKI